MMRDSCSLSPVVGVDGSSGLPQCPLLLPQECSLSVIGELGWGPRCRISGGGMGFREGRRQRGNVWVLGDLLGGQGGSC